MIQCSLYQNSSKSQLDVVKFVQKEVSLMIITIKVQTDFDVSESCKIYVVDMQNVQIFVAQSLTEFLRDLL